MVQLTFKLAIAAQSSEQFQNEIAQRLKILATPLFEILLNIFALY